MGCDWCNLLACQLYYPVVFGVVLAHTPCLFSIDLNTVRQHLVIVHFLLLLLLSGTLFQMMSDVPHHSHHLSLV